MTGSTVPTRYWQRLDDGRIQCDLCPRYCKLREGQRGLCFVRACEGGEVVLSCQASAEDFDARVTDFALFGTTWRLPDSTCKHPIQVSL